jgi:mannitol/fructose-specific phosphotransferase system IIA component (Ntr-type)
MPRYEGYVIRKEYFRVEVEADSWEEARDKAWDCYAEDEPVDIDGEIYDLAEVTNA